MEFALAEIQSERKLGNPFLGSFSCCEFQLEENSSCHYFNDGESTWDCNWRRMRRGSGILSLESH